MNENLVKMIILVIYNKFKTFFLIFLGIFRRALCFRKRANSASDRDEVLHVVTSESPRKKNEQLRDWNDWNSGPRSIEEHIEVYREKLSKPVTPPASTLESGQIDLLFSELEPNIIKQKKVILVEKPIENPTNFSRLEAKAADIPIIDELQDIEDNDPNAGWEVNEQNTKQLIREKRKEFRAQKHQKQKLNVNPAGPFAEKISR